MFTGPVRYAFMGYEVDRLCQWLLDSGVGAVGFDIEVRWEGVGEERGGEGVRG